MTDGSLLKIANFREMEGDEHGSENNAASELIRRPRQSPWPTIPMTEALEIVDKYFTVGQSKIKPLCDIKEGDVLAEDITAIKPHPEVRMSIKDGYAVIASDGVGKKSVIHKTTAGMLASVSLKPNTVCRVNTGSMIPDGADAVVQVEDTKLVEHDNVEEIAIEILSAPKVGQDIREIGSDVAVGDILLPINTVVGSAEIGILVGSERKSVRVYQRPKIAVMSTGHELVDHTSNDRPLGLVRDTNRPQLLYLFRSCSARPIDIGIVPDSEGKLIDALNFAFSVADVIVSSGGVSMGEKDYLKSIIQEHFKFNIHFGRVWMKPGLPTTFATGLWNGKKKAIFGLPGNPVSAWVTAQLFVVPMLKKIAGYGHYWPTVIRVKLVEAAELDSRPEYRRAWLETASDDDTPRAVCTGRNQLSSRLLSVRGANLLLKLPAKTEQCSTLQQGEIINALVIGAI